MRHQVFRVMQFENLRCIFGSVATRRIDIRRRTKKRMNDGYVRASIVAVLLLAVLTAPLFAENFRFQYEEGERYRIVGHVDEEVYINDTFSHRADILNRIAVVVRDVKSRSGILDATFQTSERAYGASGVYEWAEEYESSYERDAYGVYGIGDEYFMPVVRNVPRFPERDVEVGETWSAPGEEVHDFRANFGVPDAYRFPIDVAYTYIGKTKRNGSEYDEIEIRYTVFHKAKPISGLALYPIMITGYSRQTLFWDNSVGRLYHYFEEFDFLVTLSTGDTVEYVGDAEATIIEATRMDKVAIAEEIREEIEEAEITDA